MSTHRLINTPAELGEGIKAAHEANDSLVLRDADGWTWIFHSEHYRHEPEGGWGRYVAVAYPMLVLWWPGDVIVPKGSVTT